MQTCNISVCMCNLQIHLERREIAVLNSCPFYWTIYMCLYQLMLARALSDLEVCKNLDPVKEEICDVDLHIFFLDSKAILDSQYSDSLLLQQPQSE